MHRSLTVWVHGQVQVLAGEEICGTAPGQEALQRIAVLHAAGILFNDLSHRGSHWQLPAARVFYPTTDPVHLGTCVLGQAQRLEPVSATFNDVVHVAQGFYIVDDGGTTPQTAYLGEGWFGPGVGALALQ